MGKTSSEAKNRYNAKVYDRVNLTVPKGFKEDLKAHAEIYDNGSVNAFINRAINEAMANDKKK